MLLQPTEQGHDSFEAFAYAVASWYDDHQGQPDVPPALHQAFTQVPTTPTSLYRASGPIGSHPPDPTNASLRACPMLWS